MHCGKVDANKQRTCDCRALITMPYGEVKTLEPPMEVENFICAAGFHLSKTTKLVGYRGQHPSGVSARVFSVNEVTLGVL